MSCKMMKLQNKRVREGWIVVVCNRCVVMLLSQKRDFVRKIEKYGNV